MVIFHFAPPVDGSGGAFDSCGRVARADLGDDIAPGWLDTVPQERYLFCE